MIYSRPKLLLKNYHELAGDKGIKLYDSLLFQGCLDHADGTKGQEE